MDWCDVDDIIYNGTKEQVEALRCPDCGHKIDIEYTEECGSITVRCEGCGYISRGYKGPTPKYLKLAR